MATNSKVEIKSVRTTAIEVYRCCEAKQATEKSNSATALYQSMVEFFTGKWILDGLDTHDVSVLGLSTPEWHFSLEKQIIQLAVVFLPHRLSATLSIRQDGQAVIQ
jgi:hypothetical protein